MLQGAPGQFVSTARRKGQDWFVGTISNNDARKASVKLDFLEPGRSYTATIYADDPAAPTKTKVGVSKRRVDASSVIEADLLPSGGQAIWLTPEN
ncbi:Retaining alpha-galactosidase precursor [compost metagenome]